MGSCALKEVQPRPQHIGVHDRASPSSRLASLLCRVTACKRPGPLAFKSCRLPESILCAAGTRELSSGEDRAKMFQLLQARVQGFLGQCASALVHGRENCCCCCCCFPRKAVVLGGLLFLFGLEVKGPRVTAIAGSPMPCICARQRLISSLS